jgi:hypothetical protein
MVRPSAATVAEGLVQSCLPTRGGKQCQAFELEA